jgi:hypothetical protein
MISWSKNRQNLRKSLTAYHQKRKFPGFFAYLLVFVRQYSISPTRERTPDFKQFFVFRNFARHRFTMVTDLHGRARDESPAGAHALAHEFLHSFNFCPCGRAF